MRPGTSRVGKQLGLGLLSFLATLVVVVLLSLALHRHLPVLARQAIAAGVVAVAYVAFSRWIERSVPPEFDRPGKLSESLVGLVIGVGLFSVVIGLLWILGVYHPAGWGSFSGFGSGALFAICAAVMEEVIFRAYLFRLLSLAAGTWLAVLLTSALFGAAHAANPGATFFSSLAIALEAGVILAGAYALTGRLWMPIGLHFGWNFAEGTLFGMSVSGGSEAAALSHGTLSGSMVLTGGAFGPEASIVAVLICFAVGAILLWRATVLRRILPPIWKTSDQRIVTQPGS
jgi:uncharacterized protein